MNADEATEPLPPPEAIDGEEFLRCVRKLIEQNADRDPMFAALKEKLDRAHAPTANIAAPPSTT
jgi:hypothetical protein